MEVYNDNTTYLGTCVIRFQFIHYSNLDSLDFTASFQPMVLSPGRVFSKTKHESPKPKKIRN